MTQSVMAARHMIQNILSLIIEADTLLCLFISRYGHNPTDSDSGVNLDDQPTLRCRRTRWDRCMNDRFFSGANIVSSVNRKCRKVEVLLTRIYLEFSKTELRF
jgi:hypothetical protein